MDLVPGQPNISLAYIENREKKVCLPNNTMLHANRVDAHLSGKLIDLTAFRENTQFLTWSMMK